MKAKRTEPVRINKFAIVFIIACAHTIGYLPLALLMQRPILLIYIFGIAAGTSLLSIWKFTSRSTEKPGPAEFLLGGLDAIFMPAFVGVLMMAVYGILFGILKLAELLIHLGGGEAVIQAGAISFVPVAIVTGFLVLILSGSFAGDLGKKLYPDIAGVRSDYFRFINTSQSKLVGAVIGSGILILTPTLLLIFTSWNRLILYIVMQVAFFFLGSLFLTMEGTEETEKKSDESLVNRIASSLGDASRNITGQAAGGKAGERARLLDRINQLLQLAGYQTEVDPRTQDASFDPLLTSLDIFAWREGHKLLLDVKSPLDADLPVDWKAASTLIQAAFLFAGEKDIQPKDMDARLLLVDVEPDKSLKTMSQKENISVLTITEQMVDEVMKITDREKQITAIQEVLELNRPGPSLADAAAV